MGSVKIDCQLDRDDLMRGITSVLDQNKIIKYSWVFGLVMMVASGLIFVYVLKLQSYSPVIGVMMALFMFLFKPMLAYFSVNKVQPGDITYEKLTYHFKPKEIYIRGETFEAKVFWKDIQRVVETKEFYLMFQKSLAANIIKKSSFTSEQRSAFVKLVEQQSIIFENSN